MHGLESRGPGLAGSACSRCAVSMDISRERLSAANLQLAPWLGLHGTAMCVSVGLSARCLYLRARYLSVGLTAMCVSVGLTARCLSQSRYLSVGLAAMCVSVGLRARCLSQSQVFVGRSRSHVSVDLSNS